MLSEQVRRNSHLGISGCVPAIPRDQTILWRHVLIQNTKNIYITLQDKSTNTNVTLNFKEHHENIQKPIRV